MSIEKTYQAIKNHVPKRTLIDSLGVVKQVEEYRQLWKPARTNVILFAESHVYTNEEDFQATCNQYGLSNFIQNYPTRYVRFVYCLGYGENDILNHEIDDNKGTPQYWKIFSSSVAKNDDDLGFERIIKSKTPLMHTRLRNKVNILQEMKKKGIWLLDASIVGIYRAIDDGEIKETICKTCWDEYLKTVIMETQPKHIIVIGKGVEGNLRWRLQQLKTTLGVSYSVLPQPQGSRGSSEEQLDIYKNYQRICSKYC